MNEILEKIGGKRSRKEEKKIQEIRRLRQIRIGPSPKQLKKHENIALMMDEIYNDKYIQAKNSRVTQSLSPSLYKQSILHSNLNHLNLSFEEQKLQKNILTQVYTNPNDFKSTSLIKNSMIDETYSKDLVFQEKTQPIRDMITHVKEIIVPLKKYLQDQEQIKHIKRKIFSSNTEAAAFEGQRANIEVQEKNKEQKKRITLDRLLQTAQTQLLIPQSPQATQTKTTNNHQQTQSKKAILLSPRLNLDLYNYPITKEDGDNQIVDFDSFFDQQLRQRCHSDHIVLFQKHQIAALKTDRQIITSRNTSNSFFPHPQNLSQAVKLTQNSSDSSVTLQEIKRKYIQKQQLEIKKQNLELRETRLDGLKQKLGLVSVTDKKSNIDVTIHKIQKELDKIDLDYKKTSNNPKMIKYCQRYPYISYSSSARNNSNPKPIKPQIIHFQTNNLILQNKSSNPSNIYQPQTNNKETNNNKNSKNISDFVIQENQALQAYNLDQNKPGTPKLNLQAQCIPFTLDENTIQSNSKIDISIFNPDPRKNSNRNDLDILKEGILHTSKKIENANNQEIQRNKSLSISQRNSQFNSYIKHSNSFINPQKLQNSNMLKQSNQSIKHNLLLKSLKQQLNKKEITKRMGSIVNQVDLLTKELRQSSIFEKQYAAQQIKIIKQELANQQLDFNIFNSEVDKNLLKQIKSEVIYQNKLNNLIVLPL